MRTSIGPSVSTELLSYYDLYLSPGTSDNLMGLKIRLLVLEKGVNIFLFIGYIKRGKQMQTRSFILLINISQPDQKRPDPLSATPTPRPPLSPKSTIMEQYCSSSSALFLLVVIILLKETNCYSRRQLKLYEFQSKLQEKKSLLTFSSSMISAAPFPSPEPYYSRKVIN